METPSRPTGPRTPRTAPRPPAAAAAQAPARLEQPLRFLAGVGPKIAEKLGKKGLRTVEDLLYFLPRAYEDRRQVRSIASLSEGESGVVFARVTKAQAAPRRYRQGGFQVWVEDGTGQLVLKWFHRFPGLDEEFAVGAEFLLFGQVQHFGAQRQITHPEFEKARRGSDGNLLPSAQFGRVVPIYSETEGVPQKTLRKLAAQALRGCVDVLDDDPLPASMLARWDLPKLRESVIDAHYPKEVPTLTEEGVLPLTPGRARLVFEELFLLELALGMRREERQREKGAPMGTDDAAERRFVAQLPFPLTNDQRAALAVIGPELGRAMPMVRLLQGDVGAGKTVVAFAAAARAALAGYQTAVLAPTELLAEQHYQSAKRFLEPLNIPVGLLTASTSSDRNVTGRVADGSSRVVIGTHALFQEAVQYKNLGLVVIDEQHRFGVAQRNQLLAKAHGFIPHLLLMTATPIPRTLALTAYGDLDVTVLREKPPGRQPIATSVVFERDRHKLYRAIRDTVERGEQAYVVYPLVEESEKLDLKSATEMYERLRREVFPDLSLALVHGRMKADEKEAAIGKFRRNEASVLVSTTVIEVGIDVPNATLLVIEHPERLGLSQLHQLRGRVGRGAKRSQCLLVAEEKATQRLRVLTRTEDGFVIAEEDLKLRGPGEFMGTRQSGLPGFRLADLARDGAWLERARDEAVRLLHEDPQLRNEEHQALARALRTRWRERLDWLRGG